MRLKFIRSLSRLVTRHLVSGGVGGQAFTTAQMTVVIYGANACVYVSGKLAYKLKRYTTKFWEDLNQHYLLGRNSNWNKLYAAEV